MLIIQFGKLNSPRNKEELFNLRHAQARNCIERVFGISKKRFPILQSPNEYPYESQVKLVLALTALHNFILKRNGKDECLVWEREEEENRQRAMGRNRYGQESGILDGQDIEPATDDVGMKDFRDKLANQMWIDY